MEKEDLLRFLSSNLKTTNQIAKEASANWYICFSLLTELYLEGKIQREEMNTQTLWRLKKEENGG